MLYIIGIAVVLLSYTGAINAAVGWTGWVIGMVGWLLWPRTAIVPAFPRQEVEPRPDTSAGEPDDEK